MRFHTFTVLNPNGYRGGYDEFGQPINAIDNIKICINLSDIIYVQQIGAFRNVNNPPDPTIPPEVIQDNVWDEVTINNRPPARRRGTIATPRPQQQRPQQWVIDNSRFLIQIHKGNLWTVIGSFDEFTAILSQFQDDRETVE